MTHAWLGWATVNSLQSIRNRGLRFGHEDVSNAIAIQCLQSILLRQTCNPVLAARLSAFPQIMQHSWRTVDAVPGGKRCADKSQHPRIFLCWIAYRLLQLVVVACRRHTEKSTHRLDAELSLMRLMTS